MCGIFGYHGKINTMSKSKVETLGLFNMIRGTDSCGYLYNGIIDKEVLNWGEMIAKNPIEKGDWDLADSFLGHNRKMSVGTNTKNNAHPNESERHVLIHNGTLRDYFTKARECGIPYDSYDTDSQAMTFLFDKLGVKKVLEWYEGHAAIAFMDKENTDKMYLFHGMYQKNDKWWEERPLFVLKTKNGVYFSSLEESLQYISNKGEEVQQLPCNIVYEIDSNGEMAEFMRINRGEEKKTIYTKQNTKTSETIGTIGTTMSNTSFPTSNMVENELIPDHQLNEVYYYRGRHYANGALLFGEVSINRQRMLCNKGDGELYYFINGIMFKDEKAYEDYKEKLKTDIPFANRVSINFARNVSKYSRYPVYNRDGEISASMTGIKYVWYANEDYATTSFKPKFSDFYYKIDYGMAKSIKRNTTLPFDLSPEEKVFSVIDVWSKKIITETNLMQVPEALFLFIDEYSANFMKDYMQIGCSEDDLKQVTEWIVSSLISDNISFVDFLKSYKDENFINMKNLQLSLIGYDIEDVVDFISRENRFINKQINITNGFPF